MMNELIGGGTLYSGHESCDCGPRLKAIEKRLRINQPKKAKKVDIRKVPFASLPLYINSTSARDRAIVTRRIMQGA